jgi:sugar lactone lactonase YvrE
LFRAEALDLPPTRPGFTNFTRAYGVLTTIAGAGGPQDVNNWRAEYEGGPATSAVLSGPHIAMADRAGDIYIADKDAHAIRKVRRDGSIVTVAGTSAIGNAPDTPVTATEGGLYEPNGLWVRADGTFFILDLRNGKVRRVDTNGVMTTLFTVPGGISIGRGLWVSDDESVAYLSSGTVVKKWTANDGVVDFSTGYSGLGNLVVDPWGSVVVADRGLHRVFRLAANGTPSLIAGNGNSIGGGDGALAIATALEEVRGVWFLPTGAYLLATHRSSRVWYVDTAGYIHLLLNGNRFGTHAGDGTWFYNPAELRVSECRAITADHEGNILITENDAGYVRKIRFLPFEP